MGKTIKANVKAKKDALKKKLAKKLKGKASKCAVVLALLALVGCSTATPASRLTAARIGNVGIRMENCSNCSPTLSIGDLAFASADSDGSTETQTATPTTTTTPTTDLNLNKGVGTSALGSLVDAGARLVGAAGGASSCSGGACSDGACSDCVE